MKTLLMPFVFGLAGISPGLAFAQTYELEVFQPPSGSDLAFGFYSGLSNNSRLVSGFDSTFAPLGIVLKGNQSQTFTVGSVDEYCWYNGVNTISTTVGYKDVSGAPGIEAWIRTKHGELRTFGAPGERTFLYRVNDHNVAVGETTVGGGSAWSAFLVDGAGGRLVTVPGVDPALNTYFAAINNKGEILGGSWNESEHHPFLLRGDTVKYFDIPGAHQIGLRGLNNRGEAAGFWTEFEPLIGDYLSHGFIREKNGQIRTVDVDYGFAQHEVYDPEWYGGYPIIAASGDLLTQATAILDINDRGEILTEVTGWYMITLLIDELGEVQFTEPRWTYPIGTPSH